MCEDIWYIVFCDFPNYMINFEMVKSLYNINKDYVNHSLLGF